VIPWNTVYLGRAVAELRAQGEAVADELLAHIAPLGWEHITFDGDYVWPPKVPRSPSEPETSPTLQPKRVRANIGGSSAAGISREALRAIIGGNAKPQEKTAACLRAAISALDPSP